MDTAKYPYNIGAVLLEVLGVKQVLGGNTILDDLSIRIPDVIRPGTTQGQIVAVLGPSGIGKTTLFRIMAGHDQPVEGTVSAMRDDNGLATVTPGSIGVVGQHYPLLPHRTALGNMLVAAEGNPELVKTMRESQAMMLLRQFGIEAQADQYPASLSGGQRQRLAIAQQIMTGHRIILMDEPFSGLDPLAKSSVCEIINITANVHEYGTIVVVSHDIRSALRIADTVWLMGRIGIDGEPSVGARIVEEINLMDSIAWRPNKRDMPEFEDLVKYIENRYPALKGIAP